MHRELGQWKYFLQNTRVSFCKLVPTCAFFNLSCWRPSPPWFTYECFPSSSPSLSPLNENASPGTRKRGRGGLAYFLLISWYWRSHYNNNNNNTRCACVRAADFNSLFFLLTIYVLVHRRDIPIFFWENNLVLFFQIEDGRNKKRRPIVVTEQLDLFRVICWSI